MSRLCFAAIVKDEAAVIERCLESVRGHVDCWAISDTGSTDSTSEIVLDTMGNIPGRLYHDKWTDFATNRNSVFEAAKLWASSFGAEYILTIDADEELVVDESFNLSRLSLDGYNVKCTRPGSDMYWYRTLLLRADRPWQYQGAIHEFPHFEGATIGMAEGLTVVSHTDGKRHASDGGKAKARRDEKVLRKVLKKNPNDTRSAFYLARCLSDQGKVSAAIRAYQRRANMKGGNDEERFHSLLQVASLQGLQGTHWLEVSRAYQLAYEARPTRAEPLLALAMLHHSVGELATAEMYAKRAALLQLPIDGILIKPSVYVWQCADELACILAERGKLTEAHSVLEKLCQRPLPEDIRARIEANLAEVEAEL